jgi:hypothetical protein
MSNLHRLRGTMIKDQIEIANAWSMAASDLGLDIVSPFVLVEQEKQYEFIALIKDFGSPQGTLICLPEEWDDSGFAIVAEHNGFYCSGLYAQSYSRYDRQHFVETLKDWGWFGDELNMPAWYRDASS